LVELKKNVIVKNSIFMLFNLAKYYSAVSMLYDHSNRDRIHEQVLYPQIASASRLSLQCSAVEKLSSSVIGFIFNSSFVAFPLPSLIFHDVFPSRKKAIITNEESKIRVSTCLCYVFLSLKQALALSSPTLEQDCDTFRVSVYMYG